jgi:hypothetical protein
MSEEAIPELVKQLNDLRTKYVSATPRQRLGRIRERLNDPSAGPNQLVTHVSAVEAFARCLLLHKKASQKSDLIKVYRKYKHKDPDELVKEYLKLKCGKSPEEFFGVDAWENFRHAVNYRNLLVHECTYLSNVRFEIFSRACNVVISALAKAAGLEWEIRN